MSPNEIICELEWKFRNKIVPDELASFKQMLRFTLEVVQFKDKDLYEILEESLNGVLVTENTKETL